jgi:hypothetical protein
MTQDANQNLSVDPPQPDHPRKHDGWFSWLPWWIPMWIIAVSVGGLIVIAAGMMLVLELPI